MSPQLLAMLQRIDRETRALVASVRRSHGDDGSRYPRDYYAPADLLRTTRGPGARWFPLSSEDASRPSSNVLR